MSHFYGKLQGSRGEGTRSGTKSSGMTSYAAGWKGAIQTHVYYDEVNDRDCFEVALVPWQGSGGWSRALMKGHLDSNSDESMDVERAMAAIQMVLRSLSAYNDQSHSE